jgi:hypothetical protein
VGQQEAETPGEDGAQWPSAPPTEAELRDVTRQCRDRMMAHMVLTAIQVCVETHPELLREALGKVFDLSAVEDTGKRTMLVLANIQKDIADIRGHLQERGDEQQELDKCQDSLSLRLDSLAKRCKAAEQYLKDFGELAKRCGFQTSKKTG